MKTKGQVALDAFLALAAYLAMGALLISITLVIHSQASAIHTQALATAKAQHCALILNSVYANHVPNAAIMLPNCFPGGPHRIAAQADTVRRYRELFSPAAFLVPLDDTQSHLSIEMTVHYD